jgi:hypothetical protein
MGIRIRGLPELDVGGGAVVVGCVVPGGRDVVVVVVVGWPPPRNGGSGMPGPNDDGNVKGPEPKGFGIVPVGAEFVAVPEG